MSFKIHTPSTITELGYFLGVNYRTAHRLNGILGLLRGNVTPRTSDAMWPYNPSPKADGAELISAVNAAIPKRVPEQVRADISQEMILGILEGEISLEDVKKQVNAYLRRFWKEYDWDRWTLSLDQPLPGTDFGNMYDVIAGGAT